MITDEAMNLVDLRAEPGPWTIGGKAAGLHRLAALGLPVPEGCVLPAEADDTDIERLATEAAARWKPARLAVRSSGVAEDSVDASFAGQFETLLDVEPNAADIVQAIRRVRASVEAAHVASYGRSSDLRMAVLLMPMLDADSAGIAFTRDPVTGERKVVIEAVEGIADELAAGEVAGERWHVAERAERLTDLGVLDARRATAIADLALQIEELEGSPQDIEWAFVGDSLQLLQARPITTIDEIEPIPMDDEIPPGPWEWDSTHNRSPVSPLMADVFPAGMLRGSRLLAQEYGMPIDHLAIRAINGYFYIQVVPPAGNPGRPLPPPPVFRLLFKLVPSLRRRERAAKLALANKVYQDWHDRWRSVRRPEVEARLSEWFDLELSQLSDPVLAETFSEAVELARDTFAWNMVTDPAYLIPLADLNRFIVRHLGEGVETAIRLVAGSSRSEYRDSVAALADQVTPAIREAVERGDGDVLVELVELDPDFAGAYRRHQRAHGASILGFDFDCPTLLEDPLGELRRIVSLPPEGPDPSADAAALATDLAAKLPAELRGEFEGLVAEARRTYWIREEGNAVLFCTFGALRQFMLEVGRRMMMSGHAGRPDDAAFLTVDEIERWLAQPGDVSETIRIRRGQRRWATLHTPPATYGEVIPPPGPESLPPNVARVMEVFDLVIAHDQRPAELEDGVDGVAAAPGVHTGPVRVVEGPHQFEKVRPGDVLVAPVTTSSWEVLFPHIGALVTEGGGILSHPAIVAREYGLPAVVGFEDATRRFTDGEVVTVNGGLGTVTPVAD